MTEQQLYILQEAQTLVSDLLRNQLSKDIRFHTLEHTQEVVAASQLLADTMNLSSDDRFALLLAAWFHDTGYVKGTAKDHETYSVQIAEEFIQAKGLDEETKQKVIGCILATRIPQNPTTLLEEILCDADLFHLGTDTFKQKSKLLRAEIEALEHTEYTKKEWRRMNIRFMQNHRYFTPYGQQMLQPVKEKHLAELLKKEQQNEETMKPEKKEKKEKIKDPVAAKAAEEAKQRKEKLKEVDRSIATVFRIMAQNHSALSQMADSKANILISVNSIILSLLIGSLITHLAVNPALQIPMAIISIVCVTSIVFGILATRPTVSSGRFSREDIAAKRTNLLFFGNFHNMSLEDYNWGMTEMLNDKEYMNNSMIKDNYYLGVVLARKYKYLRIAYNVFMYGLIVAVLAFAISFMIPKPAEVYVP
ncbi:MAG: DUF5706 domain-containing protein [Chitinophagaceae bacterium]|nr:DUF5706 domain-containing protein [Chitinophagaceae bacterium]